jgi:hypothetical protein
MKECIKICIIMFLLSSCLYCKVTLKTKTGNANLNEIRILQLRNKTERIILFEKKTENLDNENNFKNFKKKFNLKKLNIDKKDIIKISLKIFLFLQIFNVLIFMIVSQAHIFSKANFLFLMKI